MLLSKTGKTAPIISNYLNIHENVEAFVEECILINTVYTTKTMFSREYHQAISRSFSICEDIGIACLLPHVLYIQVMNSYNKKIQ